MSERRVLILGAGIMGLSAAWALAKSGHAVQIVDQGPIPNPMGASVDRHRLIRYPYGDQDGYVRMVAEAFPIWEELWRDLGTSYYLETGTLAFDTGNEGWAARSRLSLTRCGIAFENLRPQEIARRYPMLDTSGIDEALFLPSGGVLMADQIVAALARHLSRMGVEILSGIKVLDLDPVAGRLRLEDGGTMEADHLLVAAGPWAPGLLPGIARRVTPSRQVLVYLEPPARLATHWAAAPMILAIDHENGFYAVPPAAGLGLKVGNHRFSLQGHPDRAREAGDAEAREIFDLCRGRFRHHGEYRIAQAKTCFYDVEPEERFILEAITDRTWVMSGFSGHGFKFGPLLGRRIAAAMDGSEDAGKIASWAAGRAA